VSGELMRSSIEPKSILDSLTGVLLRVIAGLPSDAERLAGSEDPGRPKIGFGFSAVIAAVWACSTAR